MFLQGHSVPALTTDFVVKYVCVLYCMKLLMIFNGVFHQGVGIDQEYLPTNHGFDHYTVSCQACTFHIVSFLKMSEARLCNGCKCQHLFSVVRGVRVK